MKSVRFYYYYRLFEIKLFVLCILLPILSSNIGQLRDQAAYDYHYQMLKS